MNLAKVGVFSVLAIGCTIGCEQRRDEPVTQRSPDQPVVTPASPGSPENRPVIARTDEPSTNRVGAVKGKNSAAVEAITQARCAREQRCGNIGPDDKFESTAQCSEKTRADWFDDLNSYDCPGGIVQKELSECLEEIKNEDCNDPFDKLGRVMACRASDICKDVE